MEGHRVVRRTRPALVYIFAKRNLPFPFAQGFRPAEHESSHQSASIIAPQALALFNGEFVVRARIRILAETRLTVNARTVEACRIVFGRPRGPTSRARWPFFARRPGISCPNTDFSGPTRATSEAALRTAFAHFLSYPPERQQVFVSRLSPCPRPTRKRIRIMQHFEQAGSRRDFLCHREGLWRHCPLLLGRQRVPLSASKRSRRDRGSRRRGTHQSRGRFLTAPHKRDFSVHGWQPAVSTRSTTSRWLTMSPAARSQSVKRVFTPMAVTENARSWHAAARGSIRPKRAGRVRLVSSRRRMH